jgi:signal transduction histidine kinase
MSIVGLRRLGELIRDQRHVLLARWRQQVRQLPSAKNLSVPALNDHVPELIDELAGALEFRTEETIEKTLLQGSPPAHGRQRLQDGFDIEEVVGEYNVLRACIHDLAEENGIFVHGSDLRVVNRVIDEAIGLAVQTYATQLALEVKQRREEHLTFVAHDLHTPLKAIAMTVSAFERTMGQSARNEATEQLLRVLRRNIRQLEQLVIEVIKANTDSPQDAMQKIVRREFDLWPLVERLIHDLRPVADTASIELINNVPDDLQTYADAGLLTRIFENLLSHAINFAPRAKVVVEAWRGDHGSVECRVSDNGPGMPSDRLNKLFEGRMPVKAGEEDIGLGLAIVKQFVEAHGGTIVADSTEGVGTTIQFTLPPRPAQ